MFSHITIGITDFDRALRFYTPLMARLGAVVRFTDPSVPWAAWQPQRKDRPLFILTTPHDGRAAQPGNGAMIAFMATDRATVREAHAIALREGGRDAGPPGLRPQYHDAYYGAYVHDPDGNKICIVCHAAENDAPEGGR